MGRKQAPTRKPNRPFVGNNGVTRTGNVTKVYDKELFARIRKRLKLDKDQLTDKVMKDVTRLTTLFIADWIIENPEGFDLQVGFDKKSPMGVLTVSKHLPKEFRDNQEETIESIKNLDIGEIRRSQLLKRFDITVGHAIDYQQLKELGELVPHINLGTYFYKYRIMWFNKRNCKTKKASCYTFVPDRPLNRKMHEKIIQGKDYFELNFHNFHRHKIGAKI